MTTKICALALAGAMGLSACNDPAATNVAGTAAATGVIGAIAAAGLGANPAWTAVAGVAAGTAGALYARHENRKDCAYYTGNGDEVVVRDCVDV
ncbi:MAG: hypothetical protein AAGH83_05110 [Pseudomonadota bacterium]